MTGSNFDAFIQEGDIVVNGLPQQVPLATSTNPTRRRPGHPGQAHPRAVNQSQRRYSEQDLRGLALRRRRGPHREARRPLLDQGQRRDMDLGPYRAVSPQRRPSTRRLPSRPTTRREPTTMSPTATTFVQGNYNISLAVDPTNPNIVYFGGTSDGQTSGLIRHRRHRHLRLARLRPVRQQSQRRRQARDQHQRPDPGDQHQARYGVRRRRGQHRLLQSDPEPDQPFTGNGSTVFVDNTTNFANDGVGGPIWTPFDRDPQGERDRHCAFDQRPPDRDVSSIR